MFERFTDRARRVIVLAQEESRLLRHDYIGTEHILLGLIREEGGFGAKALVSLEVPLEQVRTQVIDIVGRGQSEPQGHIPFTPRAKKVLEYSLRQALELGHDYIGTEHLMLGLVAEGDGVGAQVLKKLGVGLEQLRIAIALLEEEASGERERLGPKGDVPRCPRCLVDLMVVPPKVAWLDTSGGRETVRVVHCSSCGTVVPALFD